MTTNELQVETLLDTATLSIRDVWCSGGCRHKSATECARAAHLVFPYRGAFVRHVGSAAIVAEVSQLVFFNEDEDYAVSHPVTGGDACLSLFIAPALLRELAPADQLAPRGPARFAHRRRGIDPHAQALVAALRHGLRRGALEPLEAESLALALVRRSLDARTSQARAASDGKAKLVDRTKLVLAAAPAHRWTLAEIARQVGVSPIYLTQVFAQVEGVPLYRYHKRLRLARALDLVVGCTDLSALALDLGFSSHSHFTAAFRQLYGRSPAAFHRAVAGRARTR